MKILIAGTGYGAGNIGDDAILMGLVRIIRTAAPDCEVGSILFSGECSSEVKEILDRYWLSSKLETIDAIRWATHIVLGGATLISERPSIRYPIKHCVRIIRWAKLLDKPIVALCVGTSDVESSRAKRLVKTYYGKYLDFISLRGEGDQQDCVKMGIPEDKLFVTADAAFSLYGELVEPKQRHPSVTNEVWGVNLVSEGQEGRYNYHDKVAESLKKHRDHVTIVGVCSEVRKDKEFDYHITKYVLERVSDKVEMLCQYLSPRELVQELLKFDLVISMRMHLLIFCAMTGIPCLPIVRERKTELMAKSLGINKYWIIKDDSKHLDECLNALITRRELGRPAPEIIAQLFDRAFKNVVLIKKWLDGGFRGYPVSRFCKVKIRVSALFDRITGGLGSLKYSIKCLINRAWGIPRSHLDARGLDK
jgi:polysaccharide pyruvyl transferase WcaK-like protein